MRTSSIGPVQSAEYYSDGFSVASIGKVENDGASFIALLKRLTLFGLLFQFVQLRLGHAS